MSDVLHGPELTGTLEEIFGFHCKSIGRLIFSNADGDAISEGVGVVDILQVQNGSQTGDFESVLNK